LLQIPYYGADHNLLAFLSPAKCEQYVLAGTAFAVRDKHGEIRRLYRRERARVYGSAGAAIAGMCGAANSTTQRLRADGGTLISPPWIREHK
jgi:hypothetical protein